MATCGSVGPLCYWPLLLAIVGDKIINMMSLDVQQPIMETCRKEIAVTFNLYLNFHFVKQCVIFAYATILTQVEI